MKKIAILICALFAGGIFVGLYWQKIGIKTASIDHTNLKPAMLLTSPSFKDGEMIPKKFSCEGGNINPQLDISNVPDEAVSLALIMHDPDAPMTGGFTHWVVWNINPKTTSIKEESVPPAAEEGMNSRNAGYTGPCPPSGTHHYHFMLYALDMKFDLPTSTTKIDLENYIQGHVIEQAELVGLYKKENP